MSTGSPTFYTAYLISLVSRPVSTHEYEIQTAIAKTGWLHETSKTLGIHKYNVFYNLAIISDVQLAFYNVHLHTVRVIKNVTITENRQRKVNDYPITVNG